MSGPRILDPAHPEVLRAAVGVLRTGGVVAIPTETVYGLAGLTTHPAAIEHIYALKRRPSGNPLIAHVSGIDDVHALIAPGSWNDKADQLAHHFWPGPLTLILPKAKSVPSIATGGRDSIAIRCPSHPVARMLCAEVGEALSAPSANRSGAVSPTCAAHVADEFSDSHLMILDGGSAEIGLESTVLDVRDPEHLRILRPGSITREDLESVVGSVEVISTTVQGDSPGTLSSHYAPRTPVHVVESAQSVGPHDVFVRFASEGAASGCRLDIHLGTDVEKASHRLYAALREADAVGAERICIEQPPAGPEWVAILDRVQRASI